MQTTLETSHVTYCHMETTIRFQIPTFPFIQFKALGSIPPLGLAHSDFIERFLGGCLLSFIILLKAFASLVWHVGVILYAGFLLVIALGCDMAVHYKMVYGIRIYHDIPLYLT